MADTPISGLPAAGVANATDEYAANQAGTTRKVTAAQLDTLIITGHEHTGAAGDGASLGPDSIDNRTRTIFVPAVAGTYVGNPNPEYTGSYMGPEMQDGAYDYAWGRFSCPQDYVSAMTAKMVVSKIDADATVGNAYCRTKAEYAECGEEWDTNVDTGAWEALVFDANAKLVCATPVSLATITTSDIVVLTGERDGANGSDTLTTEIYCYGWVISYTADS